ncbi:MAG: tRNA (guanine(46)-N(7))-methyltransferase TrmB [Pseudomonadota bacterium]
MPVRQISSRQIDPHPVLREVVQKHLSSPWRRPISDHTRAAFEDFLAWLGTTDADLILDSCCGTGESILRLALENPDCRVLGLDKSAVRIGKSGQLPANALVLRADVNDFWRLVDEQQVKLTQHYLLYPNPYPKPAQLTRRWHGSPAFPSLVALGGKLTVRSNWRVYIEEFAIALEVAGIASVVSTLNVTNPLTAFERKYSGAGQQIWQLTAVLG